MSKLLLEVQRIVNTSNYPIMILKKKEKLVNSSILGSYELFKVEVTLLQHYT